MIAFVAAFPLLALPALALAQHDRKELLERLISDTEPRLSGDRDTRPAEAE